MTDSQVKGPHAAPLKGYVSTPDASRSNTQPTQGAQTTTGGSTSKNDPEARPSTPKNKNAIH